MENKNESLDEFFKRLRDEARNDEYAYLLKREQNVTEDKRNA